MCFSAEVPYESGQRFHVAMKGGPDVLSRELVGTRVPFVLQVLCLTSSIDAGMPALFVVGGNLSTSSRT